MVAAVGRLVLRSPLVTVLVDLRVALPVDLGALGAVDGLDLGGGLGGLGSEILVPLGSEILVPRPDF
jgi:hypothetical protein